MTMPMTAAPAANPRSILRSTGAILLGLIAIVALSLGTDQLLHVLNVYPPWGEPMHDPGLNLLALAYRCIYGIFGSYLAARFAPSAPMRHALTLGLLGVVLSTAGAVAVMDMDLGPDWYPIALVVTAVPCAWLGGVLHRSRHPQR
jgi:hypothetical protein